MARSTRLSIGMLSAPTTEMYTRCAAPARYAARTRFRALSSSPLALPAQCTMVLTPSTAASIPSPGGQVTGDELDAVPGVVAAPTEYPHVASGIPQAPDEESSERAGAARNQDG